MIELLLITLLKHDYRYLLNNTVVFERKNIFLYRVVTDLVMNDEHYRHSNQRGWPQWRRRRQTRVLVRRHRTNRNIFSLHFNTTIVGRSIGRLNFKGVNHFLSCAEDTTQKDGRMQGGSEKKGSYQKIWMQPWGLEEILPFLSSLPRRLPSQVVVVVKNIA